MMINRLLVSIIEIPSHREILAHAALRRSGWHHVAQAGQGKGGLRVEAKLLRSYGFIHHSPRDDIVALPKL